MRGEVLHYDEAQGFGFIAGADGKRYSFRREDLSRVFSITRGTPVEFQWDGDQARRVSAAGGSEPTLLDPVPPPRTTARREPPVVPRQQFGRETPAMPPSNVPIVLGELGLWDYFWRCMTADYANFRGRARRKEVWSFNLFFFVVLIALGIAGTTIDSGMNTIDTPMVTISLCVIFVLACAIPGIAVMVRRQHDIGLSGWFYLVIFIPSVGSLILLVFSLIPSQKHDNRWGPVPAGVETQPAPFGPTA